MRRLVLRLRYTLDDRKRRRHITRWLRQQDALTAPRRTRTMW